LSSQPFPGFPARSSFTPLPNLFFSELLTRIGSLPELKLTLHIFWRLYQKRGNLKFVTYRELMGDKTLIEGIEETGGPDGVLRDALEAAVDRGTLLRLVLEGKTEPEEVYFINDEASRKAIARVQNGELSLGALPQPQPYIKEEKPNIFSLYEQNIGLLTPMVAEELQEAEKLYPEDWIVDAFREAIDLNKRSWRYVARILERWASEGRESGKSRRDLKKQGASRRGRYTHLVRR
jgi:DNA replication protein